MIMRLDSKNAKSYPIMDRTVGVSKTRDNKDMSNNVHISFDCVKLVCDSKLILKYGSNSEE